MFHVELRQRPHVARAFNLEEQEVTNGFLGPLVTGRALTYSDQEWDPKKTRLTVIEGPELRLEEMGMGRGWANAQRSGTDVTERLMSRAREQNQRHPALDRLKQRIAGRLDAGPLLLNRVVALTEDLMPGRRASERLAVAELAVWELLHERSLELGADRATDGATLDEPEWQRHLLAWESWSEGGSCVRRPGGG